MLVASLVMNEFIAVMCLVVQILPYNDIKRKNILEEGKRLNKKMIGKIIHRVFCVCYTFRIAKIP